MALFREFVAQQWITVAALAVAVGLLLNHESRKSGKSLTPQQAINMVNAQDGVFVDLRDAADYERGQIVEALNIPATKLDQTMADHNNYRERPGILG